MKAQSVDVGSKKGLGSLWTDLLSRSGGGGGGERERPPEELADIKVGPSAK